MDKTIVIQNEPVFMKGLEATEIPMNTEEGMFLVNRILDKAQELGNGGEIDKIFYIDLMKDFKLDQKDYFDHIEFIRTVNNMLLHYAEVLTVRNLLSFPIEINYMSDNSIGLNKHKKGI